jgi:tetratricopeptide (TPR) repeat protein/serine/threonine protein kinase
MRATEGPGGEGIAPPEGSEAGKGLSLEDPRVIRAVEEYLAALEGGCRLDRAEFLARYPGINRELAECLDALEFVRSAAPGVCAPVAGGPVAPDGAEAPVALGDFRITREVGRGGMGIVYEAVQMSLGRRVALKVLPFAAALDPKQLQRFKNEAQAAAGLHHQHIVPVYAVGCERGVHYYAMQFIDGHTLATAIAELRGQDGPATAARTDPVPARGSADGSTSPCQARAGGPAPDGGPAPATLPAASTVRLTRDQAFFRQVAALGVQAAEALEHAHQLGVVHRDVKPANLMVDGSGHLWVADFGLAQCQSDAGLTVTGDVLGTLRYMSPEQTVGGRGLVDHRTDVYALGATLYELLTLRPAFDGRDRNAVLWQIASAEPPPPRRINPAVPADLETVVSKAMAKAPGERYATAQELADDLQRFLRDEPIRARRPTLLQRARKWGRRHRPVVWAAAVCLFVGVVAAAASVSWILSERAAQAAEAGREVRRLLREATALSAQGKRTEARATARRALALLEGAAEAEDLRRRAEGLLEDQALAARLVETYLRKADINAKEERFDDARTDAEYGRAFREEYGLDVDGLPADDVARQLRARTIRLELAAALDDWANVRRLTRKDQGRASDYLLAVARLVDPDEWRNRLRDAQQRDDRQALAELAVWDRVQHWPPSTLLLLGKGLRQTGATGQAAALLLRAQQRHPGDFWINVELGLLFSLRDPPEPSEAIRFFTAAVAVQGDSPGAHYNLGTALLARGRAEAAAAAFEEAIRLQPTLAKAHNNLGISLLDSGRTDAALAAFRKAIRLKEAYPKRSYPAAYNNLARALRIKGQLRAALDASDKAIRLWSEESPTHPKLATGHHNRGLTLLALKRYDEAVAAFQKAADWQPPSPAAREDLALALAGAGKTEAGLASAREGVRRAPTSARAQNTLGATLLLAGQAAAAEAPLREAIRLKPDYPEAHFNLGSALDRQGQRDAAIAAYREAIRLKPDHARAYNNLGIALRLQGHTAASLAAFREAVHLTPENPTAQYNLGNALLRFGDPQGAIAACRVAIRLQPNFPEAHVTLGLALATQGQGPAAVAAYREAIRLRPDYAEAHFNLGNALQRERQLGPAVAAFREAVRVQPDYAEAHNNLGLALQGQGQLEAAQTCFREAIRRRPDCAEAHYNLGNLLSGKGELDEAAAAFGQAVRLKADYAQALCNLGHTLRRKGQFTEALAALRRGHQLGSRDPKWPYPSAKWVARCERLVALDGRLPAILKGDAAPAGPFERLEFAQLCSFKSRYTDAARFYRDAFAARPALAGDVQRGYRYQAARAAARAGCGRGEGAPDLDAEARAGWRRQALDWLRADLAAWAEQNTAGTAQARAHLRQTLQNWHGDIALAGLRDPKSLSELPEAEREAWRQLWADSAALLRQAQGPSRP